MKRDILDRIPTPGGEDRAVSPVVGVALLIAITVILAAVIGFVVLNESTSTTDAPQAQLNFNLQDTDVIHEGGDQFEVENVVVRYDGADQGDDLTNFDFTSGEIFKTGSKIDLSSATAPDPDETVTVVWQDPDSDREVNLGQATAP